MNHLSAISPSDLRRAADIKERILLLQDELGQLLGGTAPTIQAPVAVAGRPAAGKRKRRLSAQGLANIRAGVLKREAARLAEGSESNGGTKRYVSPALRKARSEAMKARWAARKASGKKAL